MVRVRVFRRASVRRRRCVGPYRMIGRKSGGRRGPSGGRRHPIRSRSQAHRIRLLRVRPKKKSHHQSPKMNEIETHDSHKPQPPIRTGFDLGWIPKVGETKDPRRQIEHHDVRTTGRFLEFAGTDVFGRVVGYQMEIAAVDGHGDRLNWKS
jgi:hypothetical protein